MYKRGVSPIVTTVLVVLLSLVAVGIVYSVLKGGLGDSLDSTPGTGQYTLQFEIPLQSVFVNHTSKEVTFLITRKAGEGDLRGFLIALDDHLGNSQTNRSYENTAVRELETLRVRFFHSLPGNVTQITVAPFIGTANDNSALGTPFATIPIGPSGGGGTSVIGPGSQNSSCGDTLDNDGDGLADYPFDPSCVSYLGDEYSISAPRTPSYAYAWERNALQDFETIVPWYWIHEVPIDCSWLMYRAHGNCKGVSGVVNTKNVTIMASYLNAQPAGHRTLFFWDTHRVLSDVRYDNLTDPVSGTAYYSPWSDRGMPLVQERLRTLLENYSASGGPAPDYVVFDYEDGLFSNWGLTNEISRALYNESRFYSEVVPELGFSDLNLVMNYPPNYTYTTQYNLVMNALRARYFNNATTSVIHEYYPNAIVLNYNEMYLNTTYGMPDFNGHPRIVDATQGPGSILGDRQTPSLYGFLDQITDAPGKIAPNYLYTQTPFNSFRYEANSMRSSSLIQTPVYPWIAWRNYEGADFEPDGIIDWPVSMHTTDLFQENMLHALLAGAPNLLLWNANQYADPQSDQYVNRTLNEFNRIAGYQGRTSLITNLTSWVENYTLTGTRSGGRNVWRFTPNLDGFSSPAVASGSALSSTIVIANATTTIVQVSGNRITFPQGKLWSPAQPTSQQGLWIVQPGSSLQPIIERT